jgi:hypothetical protein
MPDTTQIRSLRPVACSICGRYSSPEASCCAHCGSPLPHASQITRELDRIPLTLPAERPAQTPFPADANAILQFLPSGHVLSLALRRPAVLGRECGSSNTADMIDLSDLNALRHGVSRHHCQLWRHDERLMVADLGSTNGTYLNDRLLETGQGVVVVHGDKLILGTLHLAVTFSTLGN